MAINLTNLIDLDGLRAFKNKNDQARDSAIYGALDDYKRNKFVRTDAMISDPGSIYVPPVGNSAGGIISGTGSAEDPYIVDFTVVYDSGSGSGGSKIYYKNTSSAESTASVASTSDIEALFS